MLALRQTKPASLLAAILIAATTLPGQAAGRKAGDKARAGRIVVEGIKQLEARQLSSAIALFDKATRVDPGSANAHFRLADAYYRRAFQKGTPEAADRDDVRSAVDAYETVLGLDPELKSVKEPFLFYHGMAQCDEALGRYREALESIKKASLIAPQNPMPYLYGSKIRFKMKDYEKSSENFYYSVSRARRLKAYPALAKLVKTDPLFTDLLGIPRNKAILDAYDAVQSGALSEGEARERIKDGGDYRDALTPTKQNVETKAVAAPMKDPVVMKKLDLGAAAFSQQHYREAILAYQAALSEDARRGTLDQAQKSMVYERIGASYRSMGLNSEAIRVLSHAIEQNAANSAAFYQLALSYSSNGELNNALAALNKSMSTAGTQVELRKIMLQARTDMEFTPLQDLPRFREILTSHRPNTALAPEPKTPSARRAKNGLARKSAEEE